MKKHPKNYSVEQDTYQTGSTNPPKSYQGIIAVLLILVIFLGGIVSILSMMNIRLFQLLEEKNQTSVQFSQTPETTPAIEPDPVAEGTTVPQLGFTVQEITNLYRSYQNWPQGLYISEVIPDSPAVQADLRPGDILLTIDGITVVSETGLEEAVSGITPGKTLTVTVFRDQQKLTLTLTAGY